MNQQQPLRIPNPIPPDLFLCYPGNKKFIKGQSRHVTFFGWDDIWDFPIFAAILSILGMGIIFAITGGIIWEFWLLRSPWLLIWVIFGVIASVEAIRQLVYLPTSRRCLLREGQLLMGKVVACNATWTSGGEDSDYFKVALEYTFLNPTGLQLEGRMTFRVVDKSRSAPSPGTPVVVAYTNDAVHRLL
jgi:hypothetical protein